MAEEEIFADDELLDHLSSLDQASDIVVDRYEADFLETVLNRGFSTDKQREFAKTMIEKYEMIP